MAPKNGLDVGHGDEESLLESAAPESPPACCFVFPITCGTVALSIVTLVLSMFPVAFGVMLLRNPAYYASVLPELKYSEHMVTMYAGSMLGLGLMFVLFSLMAIAGVAKRRASLIVPLLLMGVFSCVLSFFVVLDAMNPTVTHEIYRHYHRRGNVFFFSLLLFLLKLYYTITLYQCYSTLSTTKRRPRTCDATRRVSLPEPSLAKVQPVYPVIPPMKDFPPAYA
eukprot:scpid80172/ scgid14571/ 